MYQIVLSEHFKKTFKKLLHKNPFLQEKLEKTLDLLSINPAYPSLHSHKVDTKRNKDIWSSRITGDWRLGWIFDEKNQTAIIICLEIGTHSGSNQIYVKKS